MCVAESLQGGKDMARLTNAAFRDDQEAADVWAVCSE